MAAPSLVFTNLLVIFHAHWPRCNRRTSSQLWGGMFFFFLVIRMRMETEPPSVRKMLRLESTCTFFWGHPSQFFSFSVFSSGFNRWFWSRSMIPSQRLTSFGSWHTPPYLFLPTFSHSPNRISLAPFVVVSLLLFTPIRAGSSANQRSVLLYHLAFLNVQSSGVICLDVS